MDEPNWAVVLRALHEGEMGVSEQPQTSFTLFDLSEFLETETDLTRDEIRDSVEYLAKMDLIEGGTVESTEGDGNQTIGALLPKGFEVAHDREMAQRQLETNQALVAFTLALVLVGIVGVIQSRTARLVGAIVVLAFILFVVSRMDAFR